MEKQFENILDLMAEHKIIRIRREKDDKNDMYLDFETPKDKFVFADKYVQSTEEGTTNEQ